jgi:hypothetical protein
MKTNIFNITALALLITTGFIASNNSTIKRALAYRGEITSVNCGNALEDINHFNYVKAVRVGNEIMPVVDLPELNIVAESNENNMVKAIIVDGELIPFVNLPELNVIADNHESNKVKANYVNGELMAIVDLPELTIEG